MNAPLLIIPLAIEWVILVTTLAPLVLAARFTARPRLGIFTWFATFLSAGAAVLLAVTVAIWAYTDTVAALSQDAFGGSKWLIALAVSFAPWIVLALGGISLALINQKLEPLVKVAKDVSPLLDLGKTPLMHFEGMPVSTIEVPFAYALATRREILLSRFAIEHLSERELESVLWHELGHVRQNHFDLKRLARFVLALSPRLAASQVLVTEIDKLVERAADNFALKHTNAATLASARKLFS